VDSTRINVPSGSKRRLGIVFNTDCQFDSTGGLASLTPTSAPLGTGFDYWQNVLMGSAPAQWSTTLDCSGEKFNFQLTASKPHLLYRALAPATPMPKTRNAIYMEMQDAEATYEVKITRPTDNTNPLIFIKLKSSFNRRIANRSTPNCQILKPHRFK
jgi:hypothetical protein